jgi:hypothetical protein
VKKSSSRRGFLLGGVAALACLAGQAEATIPLTMVDNGIGIPGGPTFVGQAQSQSNQVSLSGMTAIYGTPPQAGDLALFYGCVNTASTTSSPGIQGIAAGTDRAGLSLLSGRWCDSDQHDPDFHDSWYLVARTNRSRHCR